MTPDVQCALATGSDNFKTRAAIAIASVKKATIIISPQTRAAVENFIINRRHQTVSHDP